MTAGLPSSLPPAYCLQPYITAILASVDAHACRLPPEREAKVMRAIKEAAWR